LPATRDDRFICAMDVQVADLGGGRRLRECAPVIRERAAALRMAVSEK